MTLDQKGKKRRRRKMVLPFLTRGKKNVKLRSTLKSLHEKVAEKVFPEALLKSFVVCS